MSIYSLLLWLYLEKSCSDSVEYYLLIILIMSICLHLCIDIFWQCFQRLSFNLLTLNNNFPLTLNNSFPLLFFMMPSLWYYDWLIIIIVLLLPIIEQGCFDRSSLYFWCINWSFEVLIVLSMIDFLILGCLFWLFIAIIEYQSICIDPVALFPDFLCMPLMSAWRNHLS